MDRLVELFYRFNVDFEEKEKQETVGGLFSLSDTVLSNGIAVRANTMVIDKRYESEDKEILRNMLMAFILARLIISHYTLDEMSQEYISLDFDENGALLTGRNNKLRAELDILASALLIPRRSLDRLLYEVNMKSMYARYTDIIYLIMKVFHVTYNMAVFRYECFRCIESDDLGKIENIAFVELGESYEG